MKKNDWILLISTLTYSFLFYEQSEGLNYLLFNAVLISLLAWRERSVLKDRKWLSVAAGAVISSFCIFWYSSPLAIISNIFSLLILSALSLNTKTSFLTSILLTAWSGISTVYFIPRDWIKRKREQMTGNYARPFYVKLLLILAPVIIALLFFFMYQSANPLFYDFTKDLDLDFISFPWIMFTLVGFVILYGFFYNRRVQKILHADEHARLRLEPSSDWSSRLLGNIMRTDTEHISGLVLLLLLNGLLLLLNVLDLKYLWLDGTLPEGIKHKEFVHEGVGALITSILLAIFIILFYFRGALNFYEKNKWLRLLAYAWIVQNAFMIFSTAYRNNMYIQESGLSYKKIGVYVYLLLTLIGLASTYWKILRLKTNWYLFRVNSAFQYFLLVASCTVNWDVWITDFNIAKHTNEHKELEKYFLVDLSFKNLPQLMKLPDSTASYDDFNARDYYFSLRDVYFADFKWGLHKKLYNFLDHMQKMEWQSACIEKTRVYHELTGISPSVKEIDLQQNYFSTLTPIQMLSGLQKINFSQNNLEDVSELKLFPALQILNLASNGLDSITDLPELKALRDLNLSGNQIQDLSALKNCPNLSTLNISSNNLSELATLPELKDLETLSLNENVIHDFSRLQSFPKLKNLLLRNSIKSPLDSFPKMSQLSSLDVSSNNLGNLSTAFEKIAAAENLTDLRISENPIWNLDVITNRSDKNGKPEAASPLYKKLQILTASSCSLTSVNAISCYPLLKKLDLNYNTIATLKSLSALTELEELHLTSSGCSDISPLGNLTKLEILTLNENLVRNADTLGNLKNLRILHLNGNRIADIQFLASLTKLKELTLADNEIKDISVLAFLTELHTIDLGNCPVKDYTPLLKLKHLRSIKLGKISKDFMKELKKAFPEAEINATEI